MITVSFCTNVISKERNMWIQSGFSVGVLLSAASVCVGQRGLCDMYYRNTPGLKAKEENVFDSHL